MLSKTTLFKRLRKLAKLADEYANYGLNCGGCCVFAAIVATRLEKLGYTVHGVIADDVGCSLDDARPDNSCDPRAWQRNGFGIDHVGLEIVLDRPYLYDSTTLKLRGRNAELLYTPVCPGYLTVPELVGLAESKRGWNSCFDRDTIPDIERAADEILLGV